jgi:hypothetical protein
LRLVARAMVAAKIIPTGNKENELLVGMPNGRVPPPTFGISTRRLRLRFNLPQPGVSIIRAAPHAVGHRVSSRSTGSAGCRIAGCLRRIAGCLWRIAGRLRRIAGCRAQLAAGALVPRGRPRVRARGAEASTENGSGDGDSRICGRVGSVRAAAPCVDPRCAAHDFQPQL